MKFHENLRQLRRKAGLSQEEVARQLFLSRQSVSKWENGGAEPGIESLKALAKLYGVTVDELLCFKLEPERANVATGHKEYAGLVVLRMVFMLLMRNFHLNQGVELVTILTIFFFLLGIWVTTPTVWGLIMGIQGLHITLVGLSLAFGSRMFEYFYLSIISNAICIALMYSQKIRVRFRK